MDATSKSTKNTCTAEPAKRLLDPFAEWRDCANQWDVTEVWRAPETRPARTSRDCLHPYPSPELGGGN